MLSPSDHSGLMFQPKVGTPESAMYCPPPMLFDTMGSMAKTLSCSTSLRAPSRLRDTEPWSSTVSP